MTTYEEALSSVLENVSTLPAEQKPLLKCLGQVTAEDIYSPVSLPQMPTAGPDGYAVRSGDVVSASRENPVTLQIRDTVRAGRLPRNRVESGTAFRIMTGSTMPEGADCVIRFEDTDEPVEKSGPNPTAPTSVKIFVSARPGTGVFPAGNNVQEGALVVPKGTVVGPGQISVLTSIGVTSVKVIRRPVIAILCTGDELVSPGTSLQPGKSFNANGPALAALVAHHGGIPKLLGIARDNQPSLEKKLRVGLNADVLLTSGGVSKGDFDLVRLLLGKLGKVIFSRIAMGPGAAVSFGIALSQNDNLQREVPVFALTGPPPGCLINFETLVRPAMRKLLGYANLHHPEVEATSIDAASAKAPFRFVRWTELARTADGYQVKFNGNARPGNLSSLAISNSLTILPEGSNIQPGDIVKVLPLDWGL